MKRQFCRFLVFIAALAALTALAGAAAADTVDVNGFSVNSGWLSVFDYSGPDEVLTLPSEYVSPSSGTRWRTYFVAKESFKGRSDIKGIIIPADSFESLRLSAFEECTALESVSFPDDLIAIDDLCFRGCTALPEVTFGSGLSFLGSQAFADCTSLKEVTFTGPAPAMEQGVFDGTAEGIRFIVPEDQMEAYREQLTYAFGGTAPEIVSSGKAAAQFDHWGQQHKHACLEKDDYTDETLFDFDAETGSITKYNGFHARVDIPAEIGGTPVKTIGAYACKEINYTYYITFPEGLEEIGDYAFERVYHLGWIGLPSTLRTIGADAFSSYEGERLILNEGLETIKEQGFGFSGTTLKVAELPSTLREVGPGAFQGASLTRLEIKAPLEMGESAFASIGSLEELILPEGQKVISKEAFANCVFLKELTLPSTIERLEDGAFRATSLNRLILKGTMFPELGEGVFERTSLTKAGVTTHAVLPVSATEADLANVQAALDAAGIGAKAEIGAAEGVQVIPYKEITLDQPDGRILIAAYRGEGGKLMIPDNADGVQDACFKGCEGLTYFALNPKGTVTSIGAEAFADSGLEEIEFYEQPVTSIGNGAFRNTKLKTVRLPATLETISDELFRDCAELTEVTIPGGVTSIGSYAFSGTGLTGITIPEGVTSLGAGAFSGSRLTAIDLTGIKEAGEGILAGTPVNSIEIPAGLAVDAAVFSGLENAEIRAADAMSDEDVAAWSMAFERPWYNPLVRTSEERMYQVMTFEASPEEDFRFDAENGAIEEYTGNDTDVVVPRSIGGVTVRTIRQNAFDKARNYTGTEVTSDRTEWLPLRSVVLPETIETIEDSVFSYCQDLELLICYAPLETTGRALCSPYCGKLKEAVFVNGVHMIDNYAFNGCASLTDIYWGNDLRDIGENAFIDTALENLTVDAEHIGNGAFRRAKLKSLTLTDRVKRIEMGAFAENPDLTEIRIGFTDADVFEEYSHFQGAAESGITTIVPERITEEEMKAMQRKLSAGNFNYLNNENVLTPGDVTAPRKDRPDAEALRETVVR